MAKFYSNSNITDMHLISHRNAGPYPTLDLVKRLCELCDGGVIANVH